MALPRNEQGPQCLRSVPLFDNLHLENSFEDNGVPGMTSFSSVSQRSWPHSAAEVQQEQVCSPLVRSSLNLTHRWCSETERPVIEEGDVYLLAAAAYICIELHSARYPDPAPFQLPDPRHPIRSLTELLTSLAAILGRRQPHTVPPVHGCARSCDRRIPPPGVSELRVGDLHASRLGVSLRGSLLLEGPASSAAFPTGDWLTAHCSRAFLPEFLHAWPCVLPVTVSGTAHSPWSPLRVASGVLLGSFRAWSGSAFCCLGLAEGKASLVSVRISRRPFSERTFVAGTFLFCNFFSFQFELVDWLDRIKK